jgi:hypothetical protein
MPLPRLPVAFLLFAFTLAPISAAAQVDSITANPNAVLLRRIWTQRGSAGARVGAQVAALFDMNRDGRSEFGVMSIGDTLWRIYSMDATGATSVLWQHRLGAPEPLFHGDFLGTDEPMLVYPWVRDTNLLGRLYYLDIHDVSGKGRVADSARFRWHARSYGVVLLGPTFHVADLDVDGADELIVASLTSVRGSAESRSGEIWIYRGGPGFRVDTPTIVIRDTEYNGGTYDLHVGRVDADSFPDIVVITRTGGRIRWGGAEIEKLDRSVDRAFVQSGLRVSLLDCDGDTQSDFLWDDASLHLSSSGKDPRTRDYSSADVDRRFLGKGTKTVAVGPLNDSAGRYDMFSLNSGSLDRIELFFSGGHGGPDARYDAYYQASVDGLPYGDPLLDRMPAGDVDGNGWRDHIAGNDDYAGGSIALILGGGPHIPRDSMPASAIRDLTVDGRRAAITIWPNPTSDIVHVAWRGDLRRTPSSFAVHDMLGQLVAQGDADPMRGEVLWRCEDRAAGTYLISVHDASGAIIATAPIMKR